MAGYKLMMAALLKYQASDGMWRQLIDHDEAWEESSSSGMFTFALITGVKNGWLDAATYGPAARKGWIARHRLHRSEQRRDQRLRRHQQDQQSASITSSANAEPATSTARSRCCGPRRSCFASQQTFNPAGCPWSRF